MPCDKNHPLHTTPHKMQSVRRLAHLHVGPIRDYVHASDKSYDPSSLYATAVSTNFTDASLRKSESRTFVDPQLFELCESLVREVSASDGAYEYTLASLGERVQRARRLLLRRLAAIAA